MRPLRKEAPMLKRIIRAVRIAIANRDDLMDLTEAVFSQPSIEK